MNIPEPYLVIDLRPVQEFKGITVSGYKRQDVLNAYQNSMINGKLEEALKWCVELHVTGLNKNIQDILLSVYYKYIHIHNPHFYIYILKRFREYEKIIRSYPPKRHEVFTRNDQEIRHIFSELTAITTITKKNNMYLPKSLPKLDKTFYHKEEIRRRMMAQSIEKIYDFVHLQMDSDIKLALNEIYVNLHSSKGTFLNCVYWYLWLNKVESMKKKDNHVGVRPDIKELKPVEGVSEDFWYLWIWPLWEIILYTLKKRESCEQKQYFIKKMYEDYRTDFKPPQMNKKMYLFFTAFYLLKNKMEWNIPMIMQEYLVIQSSANINTIYKDIKLYLESTLSHEDKNILYEQYMSLIFKYEETEEEDRNIVKVKEPEQLKETYISQVEPTQYPSLKPLSRNHFKEEEINIEYHNIIEDQARMVDEEIEKEISRGLKSRLRDPTNPISRIQKLKKNILSQEDLDPYIEKQNRKLDLYTQFIPTKSESVSSKSYEEDNHHHKESKLKKIEFKSRKHRHKHRDSDDDSFGFNDDK